jgi:hypothetical protein
MATGALFKAMISGVPSPFGQPIKLITDKKVERPLCSRNPARVYWEFPTTVNGYIDL